MLKLDRIVYTKNALCHPFNQVPHNQIFFFKILFFHERHTEWQRHRQREKQAPCKEPDAGLDPGSPGSRPGLQAALNRCATGAAPEFSFNNKMYNK